MAKQLQLRRGTTVQNDAFTGAIGELTMDTDKKQLRLHDGATLGGCGTIDPVVAFQVPTADNGYTWYRRYASGWVEQGGRATLQSGGNTAKSTQVILPITMANDAYFISPRPFYSQPSAYYGWSVNSITTTGFYFVGYNNVDTYTISWQVSGMAA